MEAYALPPSRIAFLILACHPSLASGIQQILCSQNVRLQEELRILNAAIHMALRRKVDHIVKLILLKQLICQSTITNIALHKVATLSINVSGDGT